MALTKLSLRRQIESLNDPVEGDLRCLVHLFNDLSIVRFKQAHAMGLTRHKGRANVAYILTAGGELIAESVFDSPYG